ncbi:MAG: hypothetical protein D6715_13720 [Calditrichaeota bacterium]|nr:MAG: hypothetical protein D6715_13720 [Calditrichota bacterium]
MPISTDLTFVPGIPITASLSYSMKNNPVFPVFGKCQLAIIQVYSCRMEQLPGNSAITVLLVVALNGRGHLASALPSGALFLAGRNRAVHPGKWWNRKDCDIGRLGFPFTEDPAFQSPIR